MSKPESVWAVVQWCSDLPAKEQSFELVEFERSTDRAPWIRGWNECGERTCTHTRAHLYPWPAQTGLSVKECAEALLQIGRSPGHTSQ